MIKKKISRKESLYIELELILIKNILSYMESMDYKERMEIENNINMIYLSYPEQTKEILGMCI